MDNKKIVIITPTYNRSKLLRRLYDTLLKQTSRVFLWIIINDGSADRTSALISAMRQDNLVEILAIDQEHGGKMAAFKRCLPHVPADCLAAIVDDDEELYDDAVETLHAYYATYVNAGVGSIIFNRVDRETKKVMANFRLDEDLCLDYWSARRKGYLTDGYFAFFGRALKGLDFTLIPGETYLGPAVPLMLVGRDGKLVWARRALGESIFEPGGLTRQGRRLRVHNPCGGLYYCDLLQERRSGFLVRCKYSIMGHAYMFLSRKEAKELRALGIYRDKFARGTSFPGRILGHVWRALYC